MAQRTDARARGSWIPPTEESGLAEPKVNRLRALVVDHHDDSREVMAEMLRQAGCRCVLAAADAAMARWHLRAAVHDLVVTEVRLPDAPDFELVERATADGLLPATTTVVFCSADRGLHAAIRARGARALFKPVDFDRVIHAVRSLLRSG
jgi:DNA-binding NtrC family response regulator